MNNIPENIRLNDGNSMPQLGLGVYLSPDEELISIIEEATKIGYRSIDTASFYKNEIGTGKGVAAAIKNFDLPREDFFVTTKLWNTDHGYDSALKAAEISLKNLKLDYIDAYLIHWPTPDRKLIVETFKAFLKLQDDGLVKSVGVSNFRKEDIELLMQETGVKPVLNQIELHPYFTQNELKEFLKANDIAVQAWSPLGRKSDLLNDSVITAISEKYNRTPAQIVLKWHIQLGNIVIPKTVNHQRLKENFMVFDFDLDKKDLDSISSLNSNKRLGPDPSSFE